MSADILIPLAVFALAASWTPGPNNAMLAASGANHGFAASLPHMAGVVLGFGLMVFLVALGFSAVFEALPLLDDVLRWVGAAFLLWMAWKIGTAGGAPAAEARSRPFGFLEAAAFQWVNPKGWMMAVGVTTQFAGGSADLVAALVLGAVFVLAGFTSSVAWTGFGVAMQRLLSTPRRLRAFNVAMGVALAASIVPMVMPG